jgi:hypothetical protein
VGFVRVLPELFEDVANLLLVQLLSDLRPILLSAKREFGVPHFLCPAVSSDFNGLFPGWVGIPLSRYRDWVAGVISLCSSKAAFRLCAMRSLTTFCYSTTCLQRELYWRSNSISFSLVIPVPHPISMEQDPSNSVSLLFDSDLISYGCLLLRAIFGSQLLFCSCV